MTENILPLYQLLVINRTDVHKEELVTACKTLQNHCNAINPDMQSIKTLEQLVMALYEKLYPETFGGIFEPLTKVIGFTHCHYLDAKKFSAFEKNQFWFKCNVLNNTIEDLPDELQPSDIEEMIHVLHLMSYIQNSYFDKHMASLAFQNRDDFIGGRFGLFHKKLAIVWNDDDAFDAFESDHTLAYNACDIIIHSRNMFPTLERNKDMFIDYLNTWGNKALQEMFFSEVALPELRNYLNRQNIYFQVGNYTEQLKNEYDNIHFTRGMLKLHEELGGTREETARVYQQYINEYLTQHDRFDQVFGISNTIIGQHDHAFAPFAEKLRRMFKARYGDYYDYSPDIMSPSPSPDYIIDHIISQVESTPKKKILVAIALHGQQDGSAVYTGGAFYKSHFQTLFQLAAENPHVQLFIMSCRSARKIDTLTGNVIMSSSEQVSYVTYTNAFIETFSQGNSFYQAHLYAMMRYHQSLLPTSYCNREGKTIEICPLRGVQREVQPI